jgi:hypothetical protein
MKTYMQVCRVGEYLGKIDWTYNFQIHDWDHGGSMNPKILARNIEYLHILEASPGKYDATDYGGSPRSGWGKVIKIGMYDGWPYWAPTPSIFIEDDGWGKWIHVFSIVEIRKITMEKQAKIDQKVSHQNSTRP